MKNPSFLAFDLGAESGRAMRGTLEGGRLRLEEVHRFPNGMLFVCGHWHWNAFRLFEEMKRALAVCAERRDGRMESLAVDTWGVDFAFLAADGSVLGLPYAYRDPQTDGAMEAFFERIPREEVYRLTGIQFMQLNTLFQIFALKRRGSPLLAAARDLLFMPDLFHYLFTGAKRTEFTFATTSQLFNPVKKAWEPALFEALQVPLSLMQEVVPAGTVLAPVADAILQETGLPPLPAVAVAAHDTGSAVAAVPAEGEDWAFLSSGTWSLLGVELPAPVITDAAREANFTNEGGVDGTTRFLKNITGLWLLQGCRRQWAAEDGKAPDYGALMDLAREAPPFQALVDPDWKGFLNPPDMVDAIRAYCTATGQAAPGTRGRLVRSVLESLALKYRCVLDRLRDLAPRPVNRLHVIGGGARNELLCRFTADAAGIPVLAGPVEATAVGNLLVQARALGHLDTLEAIREVVRNSFEIRRYEPGDGAAWEKAYDRYREVISKAPPA